MASTLSKIDDNNTLWRIEKGNPLLLISQSMSWPYFRFCIRRYIIVVLTGKDDLEHENETLDQFITNAPSYMQDILQAYPVMSVNNRATVEDKKEQTKELLRKITEHNNVHMSNDLFNSIEDVLLRAEAESV